MNVVYYSFIQNVSFYSSTKNVFIIPMLRMFSLFFHKKYLYYSTIKNVFVILLLIEIA